MADNTTCSISNLCPAYSPFLNGRSGPCSLRQFQLPICSLYMTQHPEDTIYQAGLNERTSYRNLEVPLFQHSVQASLTIFGLALSILTLIYVLALTPPHKHYTSIFRVLVVGLIASTIQGSLGTWLWTSSVRVALYPTLTWDWASTTLSTTYRVNIVVMHTASVVALGCALVSLYIQGHSLLTRLKLKYPEVVYTTLMGLLVLLSVVAFIYHMTFQGYQLIWYGWPPLGTRFSDVPQRWWYWMLQLGSSALVSASVGSWSLVIAQSTLSVIWERRALLFSVDQMGKDLNMTGARVVGEENKPGRKGRKTKTGNFFESILRLIGLIGITQGFLAPAIVIVLQFTYNGLFQFDSLLTSVVLAFLPLSSLFSNLTAEQPKKVETEVVERVGYRLHNFHPLPGAEKQDSCQRSAPLGQIAELDEGNASDGSYRSSIAPSKARQGGVDYELQEIDRMG